MPSFLDTKNRQWKIESNVGTVKRVRDLLAINILDIAERDSDLLERLYKEPWTLCDILCAACRPQLEEASVSDTDFAEALGGDALAAGFEAIQEVVVNFSTGGRKSLLQKVFSRQKQVQEATLEMAIAKMDDPRLMERVTSKMRRDMERAFESALGSDATGTAGS